MLQTHAKERVACLLVLVLIILRANAIPSAGLSLATVLLVLQLHVEVLVA